MLDKAKYKIKNWNISSFLIIKPNFKCPANITEIFWSLQEDIKQICQDGRFVPAS